MERRIHDHIRAIDERADGETRRLTAGILDRCWPGGQTDRTEPAALEWVRRWRPSRLAPGVAACSCPAVPCGVCN